MIKAPVPKNEKLRLENLRSFNILDTKAEFIFDNITQTIANICDEEVCLISLIDQDRQWFKSKFGFEAEQTPRDISFCGHAITQEENILEIEDASLDERFKENPLVLGDPKIRFYAGCKLVTNEGFAIGTLCLIGNKPKKLTQTQRLALESHSKLVVSYLEQKRANSELSALKNKFVAKSEFFEKVLENMLEGLVVRSQDGSTLNFNQSALTILGLTEAQLRGDDEIDSSWETIREDGSIFPIEDYPETIVLREHKEVKNIIMGIRANYIDHRWIKVSSTPIEIEGNIHAITTFVDITNEKSSQDKKFKDLSDIISSSPSCLKIISSDGKLIHMNERGLDLIETDDLAEVLGADVYEVVEESHRDRFISFNKSICSGKQGHLEFEIIGLQGTRRWVESYAAPYRLPSGEIAQIAISNDITDKVLKTEQSRFILDSMLVGTWSWDLISDELDWDLNNHHIFQVRNLDLSKERDKQILNKIKQRAKVELTKAHEENEESFSLIYEIPLLNGNINYVKTMGTIYRDSSGRPLRMLGINWDKTREQRSLVELEKQKKISLHQAKLASIGSLAAGVGHEINNPLAIAKGHVHLLSKKIENGTTSKTVINESLDKINIALERIVVIVQGLRTFSRLDSETAVFFNIQSSLEESISIVKDIYKNDGIEIDLISNLEKECFLKGSRGQFQQVLMNAFSNAKDALSKSMEKKISVIANSSKDYFELKIIDNGGGIDEKILPNIFDPFFTTKETGKGTGIGLSLSSNFINELGGTIEAYNNRGAGATIDIKLPCTNYVESTEQTIEPYQNKSINLNKSKVLIVEDELEIREVLKETLHLMGLDIICANNGEEALKKINECKPGFDIIISDMLMPVMDGKALLKEIRTSKSLIKQPKFIFITGGVNSNLGTDLKESEYSFSGYLYKPFNINQLIDLVNELLAS